MSPKSRGGLPQTGPTGSGIGGISPPSRRRSGGRRGEVWRRGPKTSPP